MKCISTSSHPLPLIFANKRRKKKGVLKKETHSFLIGSPVTLTSCGQCRRECLGLSHSTVWNPLQGNAGEMVLVKAGIHTTEALNAGLMSFTPLCIGACWPSPGPRHQSLLRVSLALLLLGRCTSVYSWPGLPQQKSSSL